MAPLTRQVQMATDTPKGVAVRVGQVENAVWADDEASFDELQARVAKAVAFLKAVPQTALQAARMPRLS